MAKPKLPHLRLILRGFRPSDAPKIRLLFLQGYIGPDTPCTAARHDGLLGRKSYLAWFLIATGTLFTTFGPSGPPFPWYKIGGGALALLSSTYLLGLRYYANKIYDEYVIASLKADLSDITGHYKIKEVEAGEGNKGYVPTGPSGFWVVEAITDGQESGEVVGCVGLDVHEGENVGELRRMAVSRSYRRMGIAGMLLRALEDHAHKYGVKSLYLETTQYHFPARRMYEKHGWFEKERQFIRLGLWQMQTIEFRRHLDRKY